MKVDGIRFMGARKYSIRNLYRGTDKLEIFSVKTE